MAISTTAGTPVPYDMSTAAGAHQAMLALHGHMLRVGLSRATTGADYDVAGTSSQIPTTRFDTSAWLAYNFTDAAQSAFPITVWFRVVFGQSISSYSGAESYVFQYRISEGQSSGAPLGAVWECFGGTTSAYSSGNYPTTYTSSAGDFVRYDGNSLTVLFALRSGYNSSYSAYFSNIELHLERRYNVSDGSVGRGFTGWFPDAGTACSAPPQYATMGWAYGATPPNNRSAPYGSSNESGGILYLDSYIRPTDARMLSYSGAALAAPVYFMDPSHRPTPAMKLFTVPSASFGDRTVNVLNFTGADKPYFIYRPISSALTTGLAYAFEWEA